MDCHCCGISLPDPSGEVKNCLVVHTCLCGTHYSIEKDNLERLKPKVLIEDPDKAWDEFCHWRDQVDQEHVLDRFDLALGWFCGRGYGYEHALKMSRRELQGGEER